MSDWLTRFHTAARRIDAAPLPPPEMPDAVFDALVEGRIGEIDDLETMTPLDEEISFAETRQPLAQRPLMALALAMLAQALPEASDLARMVRPGAITLMACRPEGLAPGLARLVQALIAAEHPGVPLALTCAATPGTGTASTSEAKPPEAIRSFWKGVLAGGDMPHLLILGGENQLPRRMARLLPPLQHVGPADRAAVAAVLDLAVTGTARAARAAGTDRARPVTPRARRCRRLSQHRTCPPTRRSAGWRPRPGTWPCGHRTRRPGPPNCAASRPARPRAAAWH